MGIQPNADPAAVATHEWSKFLTGERRSVCVGAPRVQPHRGGGPIEGGGRRRLRPENGGRQRPDGVTLAWQTSSIGKEAGSLFPFLIQDKTPREQRVYPQGKPVTRDFKGIARVVIAVRNLDDAIERYQKAYGVPTPIKQVDAEFGAQLALLGGWHGGAGGSAQWVVLAGGAAR